MKALKACGGRSVSGLTDRQKGFGAVDAGIRPLEESVQVCGEAVTVWTMPGDVGYEEELMKAVYPGCVAVVDAGGEQNAASATLELSKKLAQAGAAGLVVNGAFERYGTGSFPVFAGAVVPRILGKGDSSRIGREVCLGGVPVQNGDLIYGNGDGLVVIPREDADSILAEETERKGNI